MRNVDDDLIDTEYLLTIEPQRHVCSNEEQVYKYHSNKVCAPHPLHIVLDFESLNERKRVQCFSNIFFYKADTFETLIEMFEDLQDVLMVLSFFYSFSS
jgi:hypothetical protein